MQNLNTVDVQYTNTNKHKTYDCLKMTIITALKSDFNECKDWIVFYLFLHFNLYAVLHLSVLNE